MLIELGHDHITALQEERKNPPRLYDACRTRVFTQLGYNPMSKAEKLPLPRQIIRHLQYMEAEELHKN